jgi:hypothetical protein
VLASHARAHCDGVYRTRRTQRSRETRCARRRKPALRWHTTGDPTGHPRRRGTSHRTPHRAGTTPARHSHMVQLCGGEQRG